MCVVGFFWEWEERGEGVIIAVERRGEVRGCER